MQVAVAFFLSQESVEEHGGYFPLSLYNLKARNITTYCLLEQTHSTTP